MARISLFQSAALAVLAAVGAMAAPAQAHPEDHEPDRQEARAARQEARQMQSEHEADAPQQAAEQETPRAAAPQPQPQLSEAGRTWNRGDGDGDGGGRQGRTEPREPQVAGPEQGSAPDGGWRSQRAPDGQRYGRNWENNGAVGRPIPTYRGETPRVPERDSADGSPHYHGEGTDSEWATHRNRTYSDPNRSGTYGAAHAHDRSAESWRNRQGDRNASYTYGTSGTSYRDQNYGYPNYGYQNGYNAGGRNYNRWDRDDWRRDIRYNWSGYRNQHRDLYRAGRYYSPYSNYGYSRLSIGLFINSGFYGQGYWINDPWQYRLPQVYGSYRWVRYYDDVLLVDIYSGEVVDVIHNFFW